MANDASKLYYFYRRYLWNENDFEGWQDGMVSLGRGMFEGTFGAAVLKGYGYSLDGLTIEASSGIAVGPTGNLLVINEVTSLELTAPTASYERALVVVRPNIVDGDYITDPTAPTETVPLTAAQEAAIVVLRGVAANNPEYPDVEENDVVLFGVRLATGQTDLTDDDIDLEVRDTPGKNSNFQQDAGKFDDRLRPELVADAAQPTVAVYPSQLEPPLARVFSYVNKQNPSIFPKSAGGAYNGAAGLTYVNLQTGAISGADEASADFTPTIPAAGTAICALLAIDGDDTLHVTYGTAGTRAQCFEGIKSQVTVGAGSVPLPDVTKPLALMVLFSANGTSITEVNLFDCRGATAVGESFGVAGGGTEAPVSYPRVLTGADDGKVFLTDTSSARSYTFPAPVEGFKVTIKDAVGLAGVFPITMARNGAETIEGVASSFECAAAWGSWTFVCDGTNYNLL